MAHNSVNSRYYYNGLPQSFPEYYYEEDDYVADFSESDVPSENQIPPLTRLQHAKMHIPQPPRPADVTELYRRKAAMPPLQYPQQQTSYIPEYYYENAATTHIATPVRRIPLQNAVAQYTHSMPVVEQRMSHYCVRPIIQNDSYEFSSSPHIASNVKVYDTVPHVPAERRPKRHPVTLKATRYFRRPSSTLYKRPSALCLPVGSQPDPAGYRKHKRHPHASQYYRVFTDQNHKHRYQGRDPSYTPVTSNTDNQVKEQVSSTNVVHKMDSEGDVNQRINHLENMLNKFEKEINSDQCLDGGDSNMADMAKIAKFLKPKIPPSLKAKQNKAGEESDMNKLSKPSTAVKEVEEITADSLEKLLNQLKKCENSINNKDFLPPEKQSYYDKKPERKSDQNNNQYSYDLIENQQDNIENTNEEMLDTSNQQDNGQGMSYYEDYRRSKPTGPPTCTTFRKRNETQGMYTIADSKSSIHKSTTALDDNCALELHRSKSYIVNLIDRALSKELGTVPAEKCSRNQFEHMNTKKAIHMVNRHTCSKIETDLTRTDANHQNNFSDSVVSNSSSTRQSKAAKTNQICVCTANEPLYIKQLKELRWGHLRHIQREVRRLEDLERFLDTCGSINLQNTYNNDGTL